MKLPDGWRKIDLQEVIELFSGQHIPVSQYNKEGKGIPYLTGPSNFAGTRIVCDKFTTVPKTVCQQYDLLLTCKGSGTGAVIIADQEYCISRQLMAIRASKIVVFFLFYVLEKEQKRFNNLSSGLIPGIARNDILQLPIFLPPPAEQRRIAEFLGTWDKAIEKLEQLIAAKEKQQKALSNHIFAQVKKQEFQQCRLVNICTIHKGVQLGKLEMNAEGRYPVLNGGISYSGYTDSYNCDANTIAISEGGNSCGFVIAPTV